MITEHALLPVIPGRETEFEAAFALAQPHIRAANGCRGVSLSRSHETPSTYLLLVEWDTIDDHMVGFRQSPAFEQWRALLHHFYDPRPTIEHFTVVHSA